MRAVALHADVLVATSGLLQLNCVIVRRAKEDREADGEAFLIDSPVLPAELDALGALSQQARFPAPGGLLATHGDWDHLLARTVEKLSARMDVQDDVDAPVPYQRPAAQHA